jgi:hypothetical protein
VDTHRPFHLDSRYYLRTSCHPHPLERCPICRPIVSQALPKVGNGKQPKSSPSQIQTLQASASTWGVPLCRSGAGWNPGFGAAGGSTWVVGPTLRPAIAKRPHRPGRWRRGADGHQGRNQLRLCPPAPRSGPARLGSVEPDPLHPSCARPALLSPHRTRPPGSRPYPAGLTRTAGSSAPRPCPARPAARRTSAAAPASLAAASAGPGPARHHPPRRAEGSVRLHKADATTSGQPGSRHRSTDSARTPTAAVSGLKKKKLPPPTLL